MNEPILIDHCPYEDVTDSVMVIVDVYFENYKRGHLLRAGGIWDQPSWYIEAMLVVDRLFNQAEHLKAMQRQEIENMR